MSTTTTADSSTESSTNWWDAAISLGSQYFSSENEKDKIAANERLTSINSNTQTELARIQSGVTQPIAQQAQSGYQSRIPASSGGGGISFGNINLQPFVMLAIAAIAFKKFF